jgi:N-acetylglucosamine repressor
MQRGTFQLMKSVNKSIILNKIRTSEPISRAQIAKQTKLTPPTVSSIVKELIEQDMVRESDLGESKGGRKPTMLLINHEAFYVIGVDAGPDSIHCILTNLSGEIIDRAESKLEANLSNAKFLEILINSIHVLFRSINNRDKIIGIGVAMHGVVEVGTGTSLIAPNLKLSNIPIKTELEKEFGLLVKVENDARAMALGESWFGDHGELTSMMAVNLGLGVGAGIVLNGKLYHGAENIAGEIGHMAIDMNGDVCECGNPGCLQTFVSGPAIAKRANRKTGEEVFQLATSGDQDAIEVLGETGLILGIGLTNLIHIINPELVVIGGGVSKSSAFILPTILSTIEKRALTMKAKRTRIVISELGDDATLLGAVALLLVELFEPL